MQAGGAELPRRSGDGEEIEDIENVGFELGMRQTIRRETADFAIFSGKTGDDPGGVLHAADALQNDRRERERADQRDGFFRIRGFKMIGSPAPFKDGIEAFFPEKFEFRPELGRRQKSAFEDSAKRSQVIPRAQGSETIEDRGVKTLPAGQPVEKFRSGEAFLFDAHPAAFK